jgi:hypothetical protein
MKIYREVGVPFFICSEYQNIFKQLQKAKPKEKLILSMQKAKAKSKEDFSEW